MKGNVTMSNESTKARTNRSATAKATPEIDDIAGEASALIVAKEIDQNQIIVVHSGFHGRLVYCSPRTTEKFVWSEFGDEQEMELRELRNAKSSKKKYFENNWFMFDEEYEWVISYLGLTQYYKNALSLDNFDALFKKTPGEIEKSIAKLSKGQKKSVGYRAKQLIADGEIDSNKAIAALEKSLGIELVER